MGRLSHRRRPVPPTEVRTPPTESSCGPYFKIDAGTANPVKQDTMLPRTRRGRRRRTSNRGPRVPTPVARNAGSGGRASALVRRQALSVQRNGRRLSRGAPQRKAHRCQRIGQVESGHPAPRMISGGYPLCVHKRRRGRRPRHKTKNTNCWKDPTRRRGVITFHSAHQTPIKNLRLDGA